MLLSRPRSSTKLSYKTIIHHIWIYCPIEKVLLLDSDLQHRNDLERITITSQDKNMLVKMIEDKYGILCTVNNFTRIYEYDYNNQINFGYVLNINFDDTLKSIIIDRGFVKFCPIKEIDKKLNSNIDENSRLALQKLKEYCLIRA